MLLLTPTVLRYLSTNGLGVARLVAEHMLADVVAMIGTYDVVFGEVDR